MDGTHYLKGKCFHGTSHLSSSETRFLMWFLIIRLDTISFLCWGHGQDGPSFRLWATRPRRARRKWTLVVWVGDVDTYVLLQGFLLLSVLFRLHWRVFRHPFRSTDNDNRHGWLDIKKPMICLMIFFSTRHSFILLYLFPPVAWQPFFVYFLPGTRQFFRLHGSYVPCWWKFYTIGQKQSETKIDC